ncbi:MAG: hypothetical protein ETSY2_14850 [Candidatus Entotheonella gemina]|uniref:Acyl-CoA dehydrogenase/oxidase N-terminal domain-containing protein n=1 Tax=Candidatus Entotheonella gemina TaxID=1429439 RepID=W4M9H7_9BACT|nr:MAG: hypothetical protein ETSY2_14850 [Candidatus Entotheonella gemina]
MMSDLEALRHDIREWLEHYAPKALMGYRRRDELYWGGRRPELPHPDSKRWCEMCAERGLTTPTWPVEYGVAGSAGRRSAFGMRSYSGWPCRYH